MGVSNGEIVYPLKDMIAGTTFYGSLTSSWVVYGNGFFYPAFRKDCMGYVHLYGAMKDGINGQIWVAPAGCRPLNSQAFNVLCYNGSSYSTGELSVASNGNINVAIPSGYNAMVDISGCTWKGEQ